MANEKWWGPSQAMIGVYGRISTLLLPAVLLFAAILPARALTLSEITKSDLDSFADSSSVATRSYRTGFGQIELAPIVDTEATGLGTLPVLSLTWQDSSGRLWAGGTSLSDRTIFAWRRSAGGVWEAIPYYDSIGGNARSMPLIASVNNNVYGGIAKDLAGGDNCGRLLIWNEGTDTWELNRNLNASDADFDGFGRGKEVWNNTLYMTGGRTDNKTFLVSLDGATGEIDFRSLENPRPDGAAAGEYDGVVNGLVAFPVTALGGAERLFWGPLNANAGADIARSREFGAFPVHITQLDGNNSMEVVGAARINQSGIGDTLFVLLEGGVAGNNVIYTTEDGTNFTGKITKNALGYSGTFGSGGIGVLEAFAMEAMGRDIWIGGTLDTAIRYIGDYDTFRHFFRTGLTSGIRSFETYRGVDGETWLAIAGGVPAGRIDRFRFTDSGTYTADTKILATDTWLVADSVVIRAKANGCTILVSFFFGRDTAELAGRAFGETMTIAGDTRGTFTFNFAKPASSGRASGNAWRQMTYRVFMQTKNTLITPYFEGLDFHFHQDVTAPETPVLAAPSADLDTNEQRPVFSWSSSQDTVNGTLESGFDTFRLEIDTGATGTFANSHRFTLGPDSLSYRPLFNLGPDTIYRWRVRAYDTASNVSTSETRRITIDLTPPVAVDTAVAPRDFADTTATSLTLRWSDAVDTLSGLSHYIVQLESGVAPSFATPESWRVNAPDTFLAVGPLGLSKNDTWFWRVLAYDSATNVSISPVFAFRVRTTGILELRDSAGAAAFSFTTRETVTIRVTDTDRNRNPALAETIQVRVTSLIGMDTKTVTLTETAVDANVFVGVIALSDTTAASAALRVAVGDTLTFTTTDSMPPFTPVETVETAAATVRWSGASAVSFDTAEPRILSRPILTVTDPDRNRNPLVRDSVVATLGNPARSDTETLILWETTETSGIFTADTVWISDTIGAVLDDLALFGGPGDIIELRYTDAFAATDATFETAVIFRIFRTSSITAVDSTGVGVDSAAPNDTLSAAVTDPDANRNPSARDTIALLVRNLQTGETETITLIETTETSGVFGPDTGLATSIDPADSVSQSGTFFVVLGKTVRFEYTDASNATDTAYDTITILYRPTIGSVALTDSVGAIRTEYARDTGLYVTVTDSDRNRDGALAETVSVTVSSLRGEDTETIILTEIALSSANFRNLVALTLVDTGTAVIENGRLTVRPAYDTIVAQYHDGIETRTETAAFVFSRSAGDLRFINRIGTEATGFLIGETITARVFDQDQNATVEREGTAETIIVTFRNMNSARDHTETIVLTEIANLSARFDSTAGLPTSSDPADSVSGTGALQVFHGDTILLRYVDPDDSTDSAEIVLTAVGETSASTAWFSDAVGGAVETYGVPSGLLFVTVRDTDQNLSVASAQQITVMVWSVVGQDTITVPLTELAVDTIFFRNVTGIRLSDTEGAGSNTILLVGRPDTIFVRYTDAFDPTDVSEDSILLVNEPTAATAAFDSTAYIVPETATITVTDRDRNASPHVKETVAVTLRSFTDMGADFDTEPLVLTETTETSGIFAARIFLTNAGAVVEADGVLSVIGDGTIRVDYTDPDDAADTTLDTASILIAPTPSTTAIFDSALAAAGGQVRLVEPGGETITVRVVQTSANKNPLAVDTIAVTLTNLRTGETTSLVLAESGISSETFLSIAGLLLNPDSPAGGGALHARPGDTIRAQYRLASDADSSADTALAIPPASPAIALLLDGTGTNRDTFRAGETLLVVLIDTDRNRSATAAETVTVLVAVPRTGDAETITLTEVSSDSNRFVHLAGLAIVDTAGVAANDGRLVAGPGDSIVVTYLDTLHGDTALETAAIVLYLRPASARLINAVGATVTQYQTSDSIRAAVTDPNANLDPLAAETVAALLRNPRTGETEPITLVETGPFAGVFLFETGLPLSTNAADSVSNDGVLFALSSDTIEIEYIDANDAGDIARETAMIRPSPTQGTIRFTDAAGSPLSVFRMDSLVFVTLTDTDQNVLGTAVETVTVTIRDPATGDSETLQLTEAGPSSAIFRNLVGLPLSDTIGVGINDGVLFTGAALAIRVDWLDAFNSDTSLDTATLLSIPTVATIAFDRTEYAPETGVFITVTDADRNRNPLVADTLAITLVNARRADTETFLLTETSETSGVFTNATPFRISDTTGFAIGNGILLVALGDTFRIRYLDAYDGTDSAETEAAVALLNTAATISFDSAYYRVTDTVGLRVIDRDRNLDPRARDTVTVEVFNTRNNDSEILTLVETDSASSTFTLDTPLLRDSGTVTVGDGLLLIGAGDTIVLRFTDPVNADTAQAMATILSKPTQAVFAFSSDSVTDGYQLTIDVIDMDRNLSQTAADTVTLREVRVRLGGAIIDNEFRTITLTETTETSGIFRSPPILFSSQTTPGLQGNQILLIGFGSTVEFEYRDTVNGDNAETDISVTWFTTSSSAAFDRSVYVVGMRIYGEVTDTEWNRTPLGRDSVTFLVTNVATGETETRTGYESADRSGLFRDTIGLLLTGDEADSPSNTGILYVRTGDTLRIDYIDAATPTDTSFDTAGINVAPPPTASTTFFSNAAGAALSVFRMDSLVFVTVTDTDKNIDGTLVENVQVDVYDAVTGDSERITLTELAADTGVFRNIVGLPLSDTIGAAINDGVLFTGAALTIRALYIDAITATDSSADTATLTRVPSTASVRLDRAEYAPETGVFITVFDTDRNRNPTILDTVTIMLTNARRNDTETLVLTQTSETAASFTNATGFRLSDTVGFAVGDAILLAALGDTFRVAYVDATDAADSAETTGAVILLATPATASFDRDTYRLTDSIVLTIVDRDRNLDPRARDTITVHVRNFRNADSETVILTETDSASFTFTGNTLVVKDTGPKTPGDGVLHARNNDTLILLYRDSVNADTVETSARMGVTPSQATILIPTPLTVHDTFQVYLFDQDRNRNQLVAETITLWRIQVRDSDGVPIEDDENIFVLTETSETSGVFAFATPLRLSDTASPATAGDTVLTVGLGFRIAVEYLDPVNGGFAAETVTIVDSPTASNAAFDRPSYRLAETTFVTIVDRDENRHPLKRDTFTVIVRNLATNETEIRTLRETGNVSFIFTDETGLFLSSLAADSASNDGRLYVRLNDTIQVEYTDSNDPTDTAAAIATVDTIAATVGAVWWTDSTGAPISSFRPGDSVYVLLIDTDRNLNPLITETVTVILSAVLSPDTETVILTEAGTDSSVFRSSGTRLSDTIGLVAGDGILTAGFGDSIVVFYPEDAAADTAAVADRPTAASIFFDLASYGLDSTLVVTVVDTDQNINPYGMDTFLVTITSLLGADTETFLLTETTDTSGIFVGTAPPLSDTTGGGAGDGILMAGAGDTLTATYVDPLGTPETVAATATTVRRATSAAITVDQPTYNQSETVTITLTDTDRNRHPRLADTVLVTLYDLTTTDSETVLLTETTETSGVFTGQMPLTKLGLPTVNNGILLVQVGDTITADYRDAYDVADTATETALITVEPTVSSIVLDRSTYQAAQRVVITVTDFDRNLNALVADTLLVQTWSSKTLDAETVVLTETAAASGIFSNAPGLRLSDTVGAAVNDGILLIGTNDTFLVRYVDRSDATDSCETTATFVATPTNGVVRGVPAGGPGAPVRLGETLQIRVTDPDRNRDPLLAETFVLRLLQVLDLDLVVIENEFEILMLAETTETSGVFLLQTPLEVRDTASPVVAGDGILTAGREFRIRIDYLDPIQGDFSADTVAVVESATVSAAAFDRATYGLAETVFVTVADRDENRHPLKRDTFTVTVRNLATNETEIRTLRETGNVSFTFTDETGLFFSSLAADSASNDGRLYVRVGDTIQVEYTDPNDPTDTSTAIALILAAPLAPSHIRFTDSSGATLTAYRPGDSVYVLLIDTGLNQDPLKTETVAVTLRALAAPDTETIVLTEISDSSATFRSAGILLSDTRGVGAGDGILTAGFTDTLVVLYIDPRDGTDSATAAAVVLENPTAGTALFNAIAHSLDSLVVVTVTDLDENLGPFVKDTITVVFTSRLGADTETRVIEETTETSGIFTFAGLALSDTAGGTAEDGILMAGAGDTVTATYVDRRGTIETVVITASTIRRVTNATVTLDRATYYATDSALVTLADTDRNRNPRLAETVAVSIRSPGSGDSETIILTETTETSAVFSGLATLVETGLTTPGDGFLLVQVGDTPIVEYTDAFDPADTAVETAVIVIRQTAATITLDRSEFLAMNPLVITVTDLDRNLRALVADTIEVLVVAHRTNDAETVVLTETALASGIFANAGLRLSDTIGVGLNDGILLIGADDTFTVSYVDPGDATDSADTVGTFRRTASAASVAFNAPSHLPGDSVSVTVTDRDRNLDPSARDTVIVTVTNPARGDTEVLLCLETTETSGIFASTSSLSFEFVAAGAPGDSRIQVLIDDVIRVRYVDPADATDSATDTASVQFATIHQILIRTEPGSETCAVFVSPRDEAGDSVPSLEGISPVVIVDSSGGTGFFLTTSETVVNGAARFVYSKLENVTLALVFRISTETYTTLATIPAPGATGMITVSDRPAAGSIGTMSIPIGLFPDRAKYVVENRNSINDSPVLSSALTMATRELELLRNVRLLSTVSNGTVLADHRFLILVDGVRQSALPGAITIMISWPDADGDGVVDGTSLLEQSLRIYRLDENLGRFEIEPNMTREPAKNRILISVNHLTIFSVAGGAAVTDLGSLNVYPNPFEPNSGLGHRHVTFENLPVGARLRIFTSDGRLVDEAAVPAGSNSLQWHGNNQIGFPVASGVYVYVVEAGGTRKIGKVVVVR
jgi:hypothetical protein